MSSASPEPRASYIPYSPIQTAHSPHDRTPQAPGQPLRRSSPRLFRDFFDSSMSDTVSRRQATLPRPFPSYQDPLQNVNRALENANRALQDAQEAFQHARRLRTEDEARRLRTDSEAPGQLLDFADTGHIARESPVSAESHYISHTTHPHDSSSHTRRSRRFNTLDEPVYGFDQPSPERQDPLTLLHHLPSNVRFWQPYRSNLRLPRIQPLVVDGRLPSAVEAEAVNRQRENHSTWERTQARNRERQRHQDESQSSSQAQISPTADRMSPPSTSSPRTKRPARRAPSPQLHSDPSIDEVDLTAVDDPNSLSAALAKQQEDAILAQNPGTDAGRTPLTAYKCPVCMDTPTDATSTVCGHVFCHRCIIDTLNWSIEQRREAAPPSRKVKGVCPVCRKPLDLKDTPGVGRTLVPLELKLMVRKRKRDAEPETGKGKARSLLKAETISDDDDDGNGGHGGSQAKRHERESTEEALWRAFTND
jgi:hypothetical protein